MSKEHLTGFSTKKALTKGIRAVSLDADRSLMQHAPAGLGRASTYDRDLRRFVVTPGKTPWQRIGLKPGVDFFWTLGEAEVAAPTAAARKVQLLQKQLKAMQALASAPKTDPDLSSIDPGDDDA